MICRGSFCRWTPRRVGRDFIQGRELGWQRRLAECFEQGGGVRILWSLRFHRRCHRVPASHGEGRREAAPQWKRKADLYLQASPFHYVPKEDPPLLLVHGEGDDLVPFSQSVEMAKAYHRAGLNAEFVAAKNAGHDFEQVGPEPISPVSGGDSSENHRLLQALSRKRESGKIAGSVPP